MDEKNIVRLMREFWILLLFFSSFGVIFSIIFEHSLYIVVSIVLFGLSIIFCMFFLVTEDEQ